MTIQEYWDLLCKHDWYYEFTDDGKKHSQGSWERKAIVELSSTSTEFLKLYTDFMQYYFSGLAYGTPKAPKPERP